MKQIKFLIVFSVAAIGAYLLAPGLRATGETSAAITPAPAPAWSLTDLNGKTIHSADLKGKVIVIDFWATWCGPCHEEIPGFIDLEKQYGDQGLAIIGASVDDGGVPMVKKFADQLGINYSVGIADDKMQAAFGRIDAIPTTLIIDRQGNLVQKHIGFTEKSEFESEIKPLLQNK